MNKSTCVEVIIFYTYKTLLKMYLTVEFYDNLSKILFFKHRPATMMRCSKPALLSIIQLHLLPFICENKYHSKQLEIWFNIV